MMGTDVIVWSFVVPNYNGARVIKHCLDSVLSAASETSDVGEVIVVDDASGFSTACNSGIFAARGRVVFLINNDVQVRHGLIDRAIAHFERKEIFAVSFKAMDENGGTRVGRVLPKFKKGFLKGIPDETVQEDDLSVKETFFASGGGAAFRAEKILSLGGFDENMNPFYWEDVDLSYRAMKRGWKILYDPACEVFHPSHGIISSTFKQRVADMVSRRNELVFFWKNVDDVAMWLSHIFFVLLKTITGFITFRCDFIKSLRGAIARMPGIIDSRKKGKKFRCRTDKEILRQFNGKL